MHKGVVSTGLVMPVFKKGDDIQKIITDYIIDNNSELHIADKDVLCITESIVARAEGNYVSVDDVADDVRRIFGENPEIIVCWPIFSRNRFSLILKGIARAASKVCVITDDTDEVGNSFINMFTSVDIGKFYREICESEGAEFQICEHFEDAILSGIPNVILAQCHCDKEQMKSVIQDFSQMHIDKIDVKCIGLDDILATESESHGFNLEYGLLGSNKATEETLKLFPRKLTCLNLVNGIQKEIQEKLGVTIEVMVYGDGCFKDPVGGIWEFADPVVSPGYTSGLDGTPNEIKFKYLVDNELSTVDGKDELKNSVAEAIKNKSNNLVGQMSSQGTTPRRYVDLLGSLADLTSGSGDKGTPVVLIQNYFNNYSMNC